MQAPSQQYAGGVKVGRVVSPSVVPSLVSSVKEASCMRVECVLPYCLSYIPFKRAIRSRDRSDSPDNTSHGSGENSSHLIIIGSNLIIFERYNIVLIFQLHI